MSVRVDVQLDKGDFNLDAGFEAPGSGFTALLLSIPAMVSTTTQEVIHKALETVPTKKIAQWSKRFLGKSIQAQRKEACCGAKKKEQNGINYTPQHEANFTSPA